ncbi:MAG: biopolymer transporter ExbD [Planctomycetota bacterium]|nr:MAG: biopolymer transporter ExbD [Planctomycetota bacterium]
MRIPHRSRTRGLGFNMTPMIDITFLLVVFFLVASHWSRQETDVELNLPTAQSGRESLDDQTPRVTVNILSDGRTMLGSQTVEPDDLASRLRVENAKHAGRLEVRLRADRNTPFAQVEPVLKTCTDAGIQNANFSVTREAN